MTKKNDYKIEIRSDEVNDILSRPPRWIIRWGIGVIFLVVLIIIIGSSFFKYPDIITAPITVTSEILPANIISKVSGRINNLLVKDGDSVEANNIVAIIESPTEYSSYKALKDLCDGFSNVITRDKIIFNYTFPANLKLGNIQAAYTQFLKSYNDYKSFMEANYHEKKILIIKNQIEQQRLMLHLCEQQMKISSEQYSLSKRSYKRDSLLFSQGVVAQTDIEQSRTRFLATNQQLESSKSSIVNMRLSLLQAEQSVFELHQEKEEKIKSYESSIIGNFDILISQMTEWEQNYILISPIRGKVSLTSFWQENQNINSGEIVLTVIPFNNKGISGKIFLPLQGAGKIKIGQRVNVKFDNYPYMEYGMLQVEIAKISKVPTTINNTKVLILDVKFPNGLTTNYGIKLELKEEMPGTSEIVTEDLCLFQRFLNPIKHVIKKNTFNRALPQKRDFDTQRGADTFCIDNDIVYCTTVNNPPKLAFFIL